MDILCKPNWLLAASSERSRRGREIQHYWLFMVHQTMHLSVCPVWDWKNHLHSKAGENQCHFVSTSGQVSTDECCFSFWLCSVLRAGQLETPSAGAEEGVPHLPSLFSVCEASRQSLLLCFLIYVAKGMRTESAWCLLMCLAASALWLPSPFPLWLFPI